MLIFQCVQQVILVWRMGVPRIGIPHSNCNNMELNNYNIAGCMRCPSNIIHLTNNIQMNNVHTHVYQRHYDNMCTYIRYDTHVVRTHIVCRDGISKDSPCPDQHVYKYAHDWASLMCWWSTYTCINFKLRSKQHKDQFLDTKNIRILYPTQSGQHMTTTRELLVVATIFCVHK